MVSFWCHFWEKWYYFWRVFFGTFVFGEILRFTMKSMKEGKGKEKQRLWGVKWGFF
jgi:hypothetical protein